MLVQTSVRKGFHRGIALLMVILIAALAMTGVVAALGLVAPRSAIVKGESASDRALSCADGLVDRMLDQINGFGLAYASEVSASGGTAQSALDGVMLQLMQQVNGSSAAESDTLAAALARTQTYLVNAATNDIFRLEHGTGTLDTGKYDRVTSLSTTSSPVYVATGLSQLRGMYPSADWFVAVTSGVYNMVTDPGTPPNPMPDSWTLTCSAWSLQNPEIKRTVQAQAQRGNLRAATTGTDVTPWYVSIAPTSGQPGTMTSFADFTFLSDTDIAFAKSSVISGDVMSNGDVYNGGWIKGATTAHGAIYNTDGQGKGPGQFGDPARNLSTALNDGTAKRYQDKANFPNGQTQINAIANESTGAQGVYRIVAGADPATIEFLNNGTLKINGGTPVSMPANGYIYVKGPVEVKGVVNGRVTVVADAGSYVVHQWYGDRTVQTSGNITISGNLTYAHQPTLADGVAIQTTPDALGLLAKDNVILGKDYYESLASHSDKRELDVDAAAMAVNGWIGIDPNASSHTSSGGHAASPPYTLVWRGARIFKSFDNAPEVTRGSSTQGYEVKQSMYDYALKNYNCPPGFPYTRQANSPPIPGESGRLQQLIESSDAAVLQQLRGIPVGSLQVVGSGQNWFGDAHAYYHVTYNGKDYYRAQQSQMSGTGSYTATYDADSFSLYRVAWRESIGVALQPHD